jgi:hypothetical protein
MSQNLTILVTAVILNEVKDARLFFEEEEQPQILRLCPAQRDFAQDDKRTFFVERSISA